jgi:hypothetical protein
VTEYENKYSADKLIRSIITENESFDRSSNDFALVATREIEYVFDADVLVAKKEYETYSGKERLLRVITNYRGNIEETIELSGRDTMSYELWERDIKERIVRHIRRRQIDAPEFDLVVNDNFDERIRYDSSDNRLERSVTDLSTGEVKRTRFYYVSPPVGQESSFDAVFFEKKQSGDTLYITRYDNGIRSDVVKTYGTSAHRRELTFAPDGDLMLSVETIQQGDEKRIITRQPEFQSTDSLFYVNDREIKSVSVSPEQKTTVISEYDEFGNVTKESRYTEFIDL